jgi:hypothetical protein
MKKYTENQSIFKKVGTMTIVPTLKRTVGTTGLALAIAKKLALA